MRYVSVWYPFLKNVCIIKTITCRLQFDAVWVTSYTDESWHLRLLFYPTAESRRLCLPVCHWIPKALLQCVAVCCSVLSWIVGLVHTHWNPLYRWALLQCCWTRLLGVELWAICDLCVAMCCSVLQFVAVCCVAMCCSVLQCVAVCCSKAQG